MGLPDIRLKQYDTVVAVTQNAINETLATFLAAVPKNVALYYTTDANGNFVACPEADAFYTFTGVLGWALNPDGSPVDMVVLYDPQQGNQTVLYNVTFTQARYTQLPHTDVQQEDGAPPWIFSFSVSLAQGTTTLDQLPGPVAARVQAAVQNLGPDMFSIQQLYMDLNTASNCTLKNVTGMGTAVAANLSGILQIYVQQQAARGELVFGYAVTYTGTGESPTFMPTSMNFVVTPYTPPGTPGLDTLNYLVMTGGRPQPVYPPSSFGFNWVDDTTLQGAMAVKHDLIAAFLVEQLTPVLVPVCPTVTANASATTLVLNPGSAQQFAVQPADASGVIATCGYQTSANDTAGTGSVVTTIGASYASSTSIALSGSQIIVSGTITTSASINIASTSQSQPPPPVINASTPATTYAWSVQMGLQMDPTANGQLDVVVGTQDFDSPPTAVTPPSSAWDNFVQTMGGNVQMYVSDLGNLRGQVQNGIETAILPALKSTLGTMNHFVFPGATTFAFKNPQFSGGWDLASNITYFTPTQPGPNAAAPVPG